MIAKVESSGPHRPIRVALFSRYPQNPTTPRGGIESVTVALARALVRTGEADVTVLTLESARRHGSAEHDGGVRILRLPGSRWPQWADVHFGPGRARLVRQLLRLGPDVVHTHETHGLLLGDLPLPHVFTLHGFDTENLRADEASLRRVRAWLWGRAERRGLRQQRHVISITPYVRRRIEPLTDATIYDVDNPVDPCFFDIPPQPLHGRVLCVGWLNERKNSLGAIDAFSRAANNGTPARLVFAGTAKDPAFEIRVRSRIHERGLQDRVELLGHVGREALMAEFARASVLLLPSRQENAPMAVSEAMAAGVPVVASNRCGMPYMIDEDRTGFLVDPDDPAQIADRLHRLLANPDLALRMGAAARQVALERFHPDPVARKTLEIYRAIAGRVDR